MMNISELKDSVMHAFPKTWRAERVIDMIGREMRRHRGSAFVPAVAGFGAGVLVGGALGLLFAPRSGMELRADLAERLEAFFKRPKQEGVKPEKGEMPPVKSAQAQGAQATSASGDDKSPEKRGQRNEPPRA